MAQPARTEPELFWAYGKRRQDPVIECNPDEGRTKQSFKDECDPNIIVGKFLQGSDLPQTHLEPRYADLRGIDYHQMMNFVAQANEAFYELPAAVRERFGNNQQAFIEFCMDEKNHPELVKMGLADPIPAQQGKGAPEPHDEPTARPMPSSEQPGGAKK